jgi:aryl-alcohol dehydrogenase-like predicted oxidoreductase
MLWSWTDSWDSANNYQDDESETWIGEWMKERSNRLV